MARPKERRCNSSLDDIRMQAPAMSSMNVHADALRPQDDVHRELAMTCRMFAKTLKGEVPAVEGNDPTSMRKVPCMRYYSMLPSRHESTARCCCAFISLY